MRSNNPTLLEFMELWQGQQAWLRAQGSKIYLEWDNNHHNNPLDKLLSKGIGIFSNIANVNSRKGRKNSMNINKWNPKENFQSQNTITRQRQKNSVGHQYIINPCSKSPLKLRQLASKYDSEHITNRPMHKEKYEKKHKYNNKYDFKFPTNHHHVPQTPSHFDPYYNRFPQQQQNKYNKSGQNNQDSNFESIMESIKEIKLPDISKSRCTRQYRQANHKFEEMKRQILDKIVSDDIQVELNEILAEIQDAADQIIKKHRIGDAPELKKNGTFSFRDCMIQQDNFDPIKINPNQQISHDLNGIEEVSEDHSNMIKLPPFQDAAGSISSIISDLANHRSVEEEDSAKIDNIFIINAENDHIANASTSINECKIDQKLASKLKPQNSIKNNPTSLIQQSLKPQPTQPIKEQIQVSPQCKNASQSVLPLTSNFGEQNSIIGSRKKTCTTTYLPYNPNSPIKIAKNLDEAKQIDPEIVKFTEYKVKFLEPRTHQSKVINFSSPLKFRRKEQVVKHLVANNIVEKESDSIEYPL